MWDGLYEKDFKIICIVSHISASIVGSGLTANIGPSMTFIEGATFPNGTVIRIAKFECENNCKKSKYGIGSLTSTDIADTQSKFDLFHTIHPIHMMRTYGRMLCVNLILFFINYVLKYYGKRCKYYKFPAVVITFTGNI